MRTSKPIAHKGVGTVVGTPDAGEAALDAVLRHKVEAALVDRRPSLVAEEVFGRLREHHQRQVTAEAVDRRA